MTPEEAVLAAVGPGWQLLAPVELVGTTRYIGVFLSTTGPTICIASAIAGDTVEVDGVDMWVIPRHAVLTVEITKGVGVVQLTPPLRHGIPVRAAQALMKSL